MACDRKRCEDPHPMNTRSFLSSLTAAAVATVSLSATADDKADGWVALFDGKTTTGWTNPYDWGDVKVVDGEIHLQADKKFFLCTAKKYSDFEFEGEILLPDGQANSGFMFRCHVEKNKVFGYQAEVDGSDRLWSGGLYDEGRRLWLWPSKSGNSKDEKFLKTEKESLAHFAKNEVKNAFKRSDWNKYRIVCQGDHLQIFVNGVQTVDVHDSVDTEGYLAIQHHGEKGQVYKFRNLRVKEL
jgi:hypothetical protein